MICNSGLFYSTLIGGRVYTRLTVRVGSYAGGRVETWKPIPLCGLEDYDASDEGRIQSRKRAGREPHVLSALDGGDGYRIVVLGVRGRGMKRFSVAALVLRAFSGPPPSPAHHASYLNRDHGDCRLLNLEWSTQRRRRSKEQRAADYAARR